jgi:hypothetical protein
MGLGSPGRRSFVGRAQKQFLEQIQAIHPTGKSPKIRQAPLEKIFLFFRKPNQSIS